MSENKPRYWSINSAKQKVFHFFFLQTTLNSNLRFLGGVWLSTPALSSVLCWLQVVWQWNEHKPWVGLIWFHLRVLYLPAMWPRTVRGLRSQWPHLYNGTDGFWLSESVRAPMRWLKGARVSVTEKRPESSGPVWFSKVLTGPRYLTKVERPWKPIPSHNCHPLLTLSQCAPQLLSWPLHYLEANLRLRVFISFCVFESFTW